MATFFMFGTYTADALKGVSKTRTRKAVALLEKEYGGDVRDMYALIGQQDVVIIVDFPSMAEALKASVALCKLTGISFKTSPAVTVDEFDKMMTK